MCLKGFLLIGLILSLTFETQTNEYDVNAYCALVPPRTKLANIHDCNKYYICNDGIATEERCPENQKFDLATTSCQTADIVKCQGYEDTCDQINEGYLPILSSCTDFIYCKDGKEIGKSSCPVGTIFQNGICTYGECSSETFVVQNVCDIIPANVYFGSEDDCSKWNQCSEGTLYTNWCPDDLVLDIVNQRCVYRSTGDVCLTRQDISTITCVKNETVADPKKCSQYHHCQNDGQAVKMNCLTNYFYDITEGKCQSRDRATPSRTCDRCEFSSKKFVNAVDSDCRKYLLCSNTQTVGNGACPENTFFNEDFEACVDMIYKGKYVEQHGACAYSTGPIFGGDGSDEGSGADEFPLIILDNILQI